MEPMDIIIGCCVCLVIIFSIQHACAPQPNDKPEPTGHPMQPVGLDPQGVVRFKANKVVAAFYNEAANRGFNMNSVALGNFSDEDKRQFAQLIGYSVAGYCDLSYVTDEDRDEAERRATALLDGFKEQK